MLHSTGQPLQSVLELWAEATNCAVYLRNRVMGNVLEHTRPERKPNFSHIHIFGCTAQAHILRDERSKFSPRAIKFVLVQYCETQNNYRLWDPVNRRVRISRDVKSPEVIPPSSLLAQRPFSPLRLMFLKISSLCMRKLFFPGLCWFFEWSNPEWRPNYCASAALLEEYHDNAATFTEVQLEPIIVPQASSEMNPSDLPFLPLREKIASRDE